MEGTRSGKRKQGCGGQRAGSGSGITEWDRGVAPLGDPTRPGRDKRSGPSVRGTTPTPAHLHAPYLSGFVELLLQPCHRHDGMREAAWRAATGAEMWRGVAGPPLVLRPRELLARGRGAGRGLVRRDTLTSGRVTRPLKGDAGSPAPGDGGRQVSSWNPATVLGPVPYRVRSLGLLSAVGVVRDPGILITAQEQS